MAWQDDKAALQEFGLTHRQSCGRNVVTSIYEAACPESVRIQLQCGCQSTIARVFNVVDAPVWLVDGDRAERLEPSAQDAWDDVLPQAKWTAIGWQTAGEAVAAIQALQR